MARKLCGSGDGKSFGFPDLGCLGWDLGVLGLWESKREWFKGLCITQRGRHFLVEQREKQRCLTNT